MGHRARRHRRTRRAGYAALGRLRGAKETRVSMARTGLWRSLVIGGAALLWASSAGAQTAGLRVQYRFGQPLAPTDNHVRPILNIVNGGSSAVPLSELTVRYWYTVDGARPQAYVCDWAQIGNQNVRSRFASVSPAAAGADSFLELSFVANAGSI